MSNFTRAMKLEAQLVTAQAELAGAEIAASIYGPSAFKRMMAVVQEKYDAVLEIRAEIRKVNTDIEASKAWLATDEAKAITFKNRGQYRDENGLPF